MIFELATASAGKTNRPVYFDDCCSMFVKSSQCLVDHRIGGERPPNPHRLILRWMFWKKRIQRRSVGSPRRGMIVKMISLAQDSNLLYRIERAIVHSMTWCLRLRRLPSLWSCQILRPKWPCSALCRACGIDPAERSARLAGSVKKDAIKSVWSFKFVERASICNCTRVFRCEFFVGQPQSDGHRTTFICGVPDSAWTTSATIAAL